MSLTEQQCYVCKLSRYCDPEYPAESPPCAKGIPLAGPSKLMRIEYDDDALDIIAKVNETLKARGIAFEFADDDQEHDGFELFELRSTGADT